MKRKLVIAFTLVLVLVMLLTPLASADNGPTILSEFPDYGPGDTVNLFGAGWQSGESVHIYVNDNFGSTWNRNVDVVAADDGTFIDTFQLPSWFVATYTVTATGATSGAATATFTDGALQFVETGLPAGTSWSVTWNGNLQSSTTNTISFGGQVAGPFSYTVGTVTGYTASPSTGNVSRPQNGNTQVDITFSKPSDNIAPTASPTQFPAANGNGWNKTDVTVYWNWSDNAGGSGIDTTQCTTSSTSFGEGTITLSASCKDLAGNTGNASYTVKVDKTKPTISAAATTSPNAAGWYNSDVTVHFTCTDGLSGIPAGACPVDQILNIEGIAVASSAQTVTDTAGNTSDPSNVVTVKIDKTKPTIVAAATTSPNGAGWYNSDVIVQFTCVDGLSGILAGACPANQVLSTEGEAVLSTAQTVTDAAGNTSDPSNVLTVKIDKTKPTISAAVFGGTLGFNGWYTSDVTIRFTCFDPLSGIPIGACPTDQVLSTEGAAVVSTAQTVTDAAGNTSDPSSVVTVKIDKTKPTIYAVIIGGTLGFNGWYLSDVTVHFTCSDALSGIPAGTCPVNQVLATEGAAVASTAETVADAAGNISDPSNVVTVKIDKTKPTIVAAATTLPNGAGWYNSDVTVQFTCSDALSGIPVGACPADQVLSTEGEGVSSAAQTVTDAAGNTSALSNVVTVKIDKTKPIISAAISAGTLGLNGWYTSDVTVHFTCFDALSGIGACAADQVLNSEGGAVASTTQTVTDAAGNTSDPSNVVTVKIDKTAPTLAPTISPIPVLLNGSATASPNATDLISGMASSSCGLVATTSVGTHTVNCTATDSAGNTSSQPVSYNVMYATGGTCYGGPASTILQPINTDGTSVFKQKSTVPAKFRVCDANGVSIGTPGVVSSFRLVQTINGGVSTVDEAVDSTTPDTAFRWSASDQQWIFNINTKNSSPNVRYFYDITLNDGSHILFNFGLK